MNILPIIFYDKLNLKKNKRNKLVIIMNESITINNISQLWIKYWTNQTNKLLLNIYYNRSIYWQ